MMYMILINFFSKSKGGIGNIAQWEVLALTVQKTEFNLQHGKGERKDKTQIPNTPNNSLPSMLSQNVGLT